LFYDPLAAKKVNTGLIAHLEERGLGSVAELVGKLEID
jgi:dihydroorotate dehydrogenase